MLMLLVALGSQAPAPCPHAAAAGRETTTGWRAYRREAIAEAATYFAAADSLCPGDHATQIGLGFVLLRQSQPRGAAERFLRAVASDTSDAEAWYGLGLARSRLGQPPAAVAAWRRTACGPSRRRGPTTMRPAGRGTSAARCGAWWTWCTGTP